LLRGKQNPDLRPVYAQAQHKMPKPKRKKSLKKPVEIPPELELDPDAWDKFEKLLTDAVKTGPKSHNKTKRETR
jgi:hypothetical protein